MAIKTLYDTGSSNPIPVVADGATYSLITQDCVVDCGTKFNITPSQNSRTYSFPVGDVAIIGGAFFRIVDSSESFTVPTGTSYLSLRIDAASSSEKGEIKFLSSLEEAEKGNLYDLNASSRKRDFILYKIIANTNGITSLQDLRVIKGSGSSTSGGYGIEVCSRSEYNTLVSQGTYKDGVLYHVYNN